MTRFLYELRFALIPILLLLLWHGFKLWRAKKHGHDKPLLKDGPWLAAFIAGVAITVVTLLSLGLKQPHTQGEYTPATLENGKLTDGSIEP